MLRSHVDAVDAIADSLRPSFGPVGGDALILGASGKAILTNSGAAVLAAKAKQVRERVRPIPPNPDPELARPSPVHP